MSLVNPDIVGEIKRIYTHSKGHGTWEYKFNTASRALEAAIALIDQIDYITKKADVEVRIDSNPSS